MKPMPIGARVAIRKGSEYYGEHPDLNPAEQVGVLVEIEEWGGLDYRVTWEHSGRTNNYSREDLRYWKGTKPAPAKLNQEGIDEAVNKAIAACKEKPQGVTARYAFLYNDGEHQVNNNTACHATVMELEAHKKRKCFGIVTCINGGRKDACKKEVAIAYYDWLFNHSPYAEAFITKDAEQAYKNEKYALLTADAPGNLLQGALVATRQPWEHANVPIMGKALVDEGVEPNAAHLLGGLFRFKTGTKDVVAMAQGGGHFHIELYDMTIEDAVKFIRNEPSNLNSPYNEGGSANGVHNMFREGRIYRGDKTRLTKYSERLIELAGAGQGENTTNPFAKAKTKGTASTTVKKLAAYVNKHGAFV